LICEPYLELSKVFGERGWLDLLGRDVSLSPGLNEVEVALGHGFVSVSSLFFSCLDSSGWSYCWADGLLLQVTGTNNHSALTRSQVTHVLVNIS
jgi:hypothetical protein